MNKAARFDTYQDKRGEWRWRLLAGNGRTVADSGEGYRSKYEVKRAIQRVKELVVVAATVDGHQGEGVAILADSRAKARLN